MFIEIHKSIIERKPLITNRYNYPTPPIRDIKGKETQTRNNWILTETSLAESQTDNYFLTKWPNGYPKRKDVSDTHIQRRNITKINHDRRTALERSVKSISLGAGEGGGGAGREREEGERLESNKIWYSCPTVCPMIGEGLYSPANYIAAYKESKCVHCFQGQTLFQVLFESEAEQHDGTFPISILHKSIAGRYQARQLPGPSG